MASNNIVIEVVNCDLCNPNTLNWVPGAESAERLKFVRKKHFPPAGFRLGTVKAAFEAGWQEREYGVICPTCIEKEQAQEARDKEEEAESFIGSPAPGLVSLVDFDAEIAKLDAQVKEVEERMTKYSSEHPKHVTFKFNDQDECPLSAEDCATHISDGLESYKASQAQARAQIVAMKEQHESSAAGQKEPEVK